MDSHTTPQRLADRGIGSVQFVFAGALALVLFVVLANLVVVQYGRGAIRSALEQGARAGSVGGVGECERVAADVVSDLLGGAMSKGLSVHCYLTGPSVVASATVTFRSWTPLTPDFPIEMTSRATGEP